MKKRNFMLKAHREWRQALIDRDKGCIICGETNLMNAHHLIPDCVKYKKYKFDVDNGVMLCPAHHLWGIMSAHKNPFWFYMWMRTERPTQLLLALKRLGEIGDAI